ncbi:LysR family transcriptional regulator [Archangium sp.]|uniref:LysR family transcriptional regulator n=1 Tax=Archangium sp. TaxID=1872627 RepID=UPI00389B007C
MSSLHIDLRDLNLLVVLDAVLTEGSNRAAAARLGVTQSAVSHALARLRQRLGDPLVVPSGGRMVPTPLAESLAPALREALERLGGALRGVRDFDPASSTRTFWLSSADLAGMVVLPPLMRELTRVAPGVSVRMRGPAENTLQALERGELDVALGIFHDVPAAFRLQALIRERFVCVAREGHPVTQGRFTLARYLEYGHVTVAPLGGTGSMVDEVLTRLGKSRRVVAAVPHFFLAPFLVAQTDLLLMGPERMARLLAPAFGLALLHPPVELEGFTLSQLWHERVQHDAAHVWLRKAIAEASRQP